MVGGILKAGFEPTAKDVNLDAIEETLLSGVVPRDISTSIAEEGTTWSRPALKDFTDKPWEDLSAAEKRRIAMHAAWAAAMPPENFGDIKLFHHRPSDGAVVPNGVQAALARLNQTEGLGSDKPKVEAHLRRHMDAIQTRRQAAMAQAALDPERVSLELMELG